MKILSISTATSNLSVALTEDQTTLFSAEETDRRNHSEHLDPLIDKLLHQAGWQLTDINRFAVALGPGSYTGLRIGVTTVKMFASILHKDLVGLSTLEILADNFAQSDALIVSALDARNDNFFAGAYIMKNGQPVNVMADGHYHLDKLLAGIEKAAAEQGKTKVILAGTGLIERAEAIKTALPALELTFAEGDDNQVHASHLGKLALSAQTIDPDQALPRYLRRTQAEMDWHRKTGKPFGQDSDYVEEV
ncbi:MAG: tRNA (adenosine(37)-N6)-threonylcarbamoyltransferase complex dimerization subunit type 1 TsaB [Lactobacillus sp.]|jgi:tRNA threonylcarbamoyl adenosine modification protein YeaZ|nr:tRNA (adenosine(37)-N6)-threonylcarbamoyltransferase complex dimerization subunit type 1 TsaB [Lactobacillus sp.]MCH3905956.1 tRNA (adenosine(37)-N6)-threonylcarbamoyltransferase complex dimerization subunit type 1 TsaB [Lactobacillus sp.]MCH3990470.1 tRNA (adenosine(37)-N6)-threonylcarbamoyltransferase complex dimerization subunit type 1 TsaB [Lactobacillus sp.]MCH4068815.1 tRNA (adenosine(37)-N6)-threonylcarbamoyltransferase complex dimerization subunit type 1 TsaB [Lactobacillus sp.]MCI13